jgi:hypothetical protein
MIGSAMSEMLRRLKIRKGGSREDLIYRLPVPSEYRNTDAGPSYFLWRDLARLIQLGLVDAYDDAGVKIVPSSTDGWDEDTDLSRAERFYISPRAVAIERELGLDLSAGSRPLFGYPSPPENPADLFVLMPFSPELKPVYDDHIRKVGDSLKLRVQRADDIFGAGAIVEDIWRAMFYAKAIVADCTGRNTNVFYEIGMAHALGKRTILISQALADVPFDLRHRRVIEYALTPRGMAEFEETLRSSIVFDVW